MCHFRRTARRDLMDPHPPPLVFCQANTVSQSVSVFVAPFCGKLIDDIPSHIIANFNKSLLRNLFGEAPQKVSQRSNLNSPALVPISSEQLLAVHLNYILWFLSLHLLHIKFAMCDKPRVFIDHRSPVRSLWKQTLKTSPSAEGLMDLWQTQGARVIECSFFLVLLL